MGYPEMPSITKDHDVLSIIVFERP